MKCMKGIAQNCISEQDILMQLSKYKPLYSDFVDQSLGKNIYSPVPDSEMNNLCMNDDEEKIKQDYGLSRISQ